MRRNRTRQPPLFELDRPLSPRWEWTVAYKVASSGYPTHCHVTAQHGSVDDFAIGTASCEVHYDDDLREVIECLAIESMLAACEPLLTGEVPHRRIVFSSNL